MTECTQSSFEFEGHFSRQVVACFDGGEITTDAGALLLRQVEQRTGIVRQFAACFTDHRRADRVEHKLGERLCCNFGSRGARYSIPLHRSCSRVEESGNELELADNLTDTDPPRLPLPNRMDRFVTLDRSVSSPEGAESLARSHSPLDSPVVLLQHIVQVLHRP